MREGNKDAWTLKKQWETNTQYLKLPEVKTLDRTTYVEAFEKQIWRLRSRQLPVLVHEIIAPASTVVTKKATSKLKGD